MNKSNNKLFQTFFVILGLIFIIAICVSIYMIFKFIWNSIKDYPTITVAIITGFLSIIAIIVQKVWERKDNKEQEIRNKKLPIYQKMINEFSYFFYNDPNLTTEEEKENFQIEKNNRLIKFVADNNGELITWASDSVLKEWSIFRKIAINNSGNGIELMFQIEKLFYTIRKDLGHKNENLLKGDILRLWVNDIDNILEKPSQDENKQK